MLLIDWGWPEPWGSLRHLPALRAGLPSGEPAGREGEPACLSIFRSLVDRRIPEVTNLRRSLNG